MNLLRMEGVNIDDTVSDTDDLSTRRGSSLLLLQAVRDVTADFKDDLTPITTGASVGLFAVKDNARPNLVQDIKDKLNKDNRYRHMTFVVDMAQREDFRPAAESVLATNRWQQMSSFSVPLHGLGEATSGACAKTGTRPGAIASERRSDKGAFISQSVKDRREFGRTARSDFYARELGLSSEQKLAFTDEFESLSSGLNPHWGWPDNLDGKIAVFYADGNGFGKIASSCKDPDALKEWDKYLKNQRKQWLKKLLDIASESPRWKTQNGEIRLETLLWGGDEFMLVVPAWCALELAQLFVETSKQWSHQGQPLSHACALVLCHHNAPIGPISELAKSLADLCKEQTRDATTLHALVLESFDHAGGDLHGLLKTRFHGQLNNWSALTLTPARLAALTRYLGALKAVLPRSSITRALRLLLQVDLANPLLARSYASVEKSLRDLPQSLQENQAWASLWKEFSGQTWTGKPPESDSVAEHIAAWTQILEFWDYVATLPPEPHNTAQQDTAHGVTA